MSQITGDRPNQVGASGLGCTKPHVPERRIPKTTSPSPSAESSVPTRSRRGSLRLRRVRHAAVEQEHRDDDHLTDEHLAPGQVRGEETADERAGGDRDGAADATMP